MTEITFTKRTAIVRDVFFGEGHFDLSLKMGQLRDLEEILDIGCVDLLNRLQTGGWKIKELTEVCRLGLIGGGADPQTAFRLVTSYVIEGHILNFLGIAILTLNRALLGPIEDPVVETPEPGEPPAAAETPQNPSGGATITPTRARTVSTRKKSSK